MVPWFSSFTSYMFVVMLLAVSRLRHVAPTPSLLYSLLYIRVSRRPSGKSHDSFGLEVLQLARNLLSLPA